MMLATGAPGLRALGAGAPLGDTLGDLGRGGSAEFAPLSPDILRGVLGPDALARLSGGGPVSAPVTGERPAPTPGPEQPGGGDEEPLALVQGSPDFDLRFSMTSDRATVRPNEDIIYSLIVENVGGGDFNAGCVTACQRNLQVDAHVPFGTAFREMTEAPAEGDSGGVPSPPIPGPPLDAHTVSWSGNPVIRAGEVFRLSYRVTVNATTSPGTELSNHGHGKIDVEDAVTTNTVVVTVV